MCPKYHSIKLHRILTLNRILLSWNFGSINLAIIFGYIEYTSTSRLDRNSNGQKVITEWRPFITYMEANTEDN